jgi:hypothetical protein
MVSGYFRKNKEKERMNERERDKEGRVWIA